jgi:hypothetical protein
MDTGLIPPDRVGPQEAATIGIALSMLLQTKLGWKTAVIIVLAGETFAYLFTLPVASWLKIDKSWYGGIGFAFGIAGLYLVNALMKMLTDFEAQPLGLLARLLRAWRGDDK